MHLTWPAWILVICLLASFVCAIVAASVAVLALARFSKHLKRTSNEAAALVDAKRLEMNIARITGLVDGVEPFVDRSRVAIASINAALGELRLPEAMLAVRTASATVRLLFSGR